MNYVFHFIEINFNGAPFRWITKVPRHKFLFYTDSYLI